MVRLQNFLLGILIFSHNLAMAGPYLEAQETNCPGLFGGKFSSFGARKKAYEDEFLAWGRAGLLRLIFKDPSPTELANEERWMVFWEKTPPNNPPRHARLIRSIRGDRSPPKKHPWRLNPLGSLQFAFQYNVRSGSRNLVALGLMRNEKRFTKPAMFLLTLPWTSLPLEGYFALLDKMERDRK